MGIFDATSRTFTNLHSTKSSTHTTKPNMYVVGSTSSRHCMQLHALSQIYEISCNFTHFRKFTQHEKLHAHHHSKNVWSVFHLLPTLLAHDLLHSICFIKTSSNTKKAYVILWSLYTLLTTILFRPPTNKQHHSPTNPNQYFTGVVVCNFTKFHQLLSSLQQNSAPFQKYHGIATTTGTKWWITSGKGDYFWSELMLNDTMPWPHMKHTVDRRLIVSAKLLIEKHNKWIAPSALPADATKSPPVMLSLLMSWVCTSCFEYMDIDNRVQCNHPNCSAAVHKDCLNNNKAWYCQPHV